MATVQSSDGTSISYDIDGKGPPVVLLHGGATDKTSWRHASYLSSLSSHFRLISIDARGAGQSDKPSDPDLHSMDAYVADVDAVLDGLGIKDFVCWGYSMGGQTALELTVMKPQRVRALIVTGAEIDPWSPREEYEEIMGMIQSEGMQAAVREFDTPEDPLPAWYKRLIIETDRDVFLAAMQARLTWEGVGQRIDRITMPTLFLGGEYEDEPGDLEAMVERVPHATAQRVQGVGHAGIFARSDLVLPYAKPFLGSSGL